MPRLRAGRSRQFTRRSVQADLQVDRRRTPRPRRHAQGAAFGQQEGPENFRRLNGACFLLGLSYFRTCCAKENDATMQLAQSASTTWLAAAHSRHPPQAQAPQSAPVMHFRSVVLNDSKTDPDAHAMITNPLSETTLKSMCVARQHLSLTLHRPHGPWRRRHCIAL